MKVTQANLATLGRQIDHEVRRLIDQGRNKERPADIFERVTEIVCPIVDPLVLETYQRALRGLILSGKPDPNVAATGRMSLRLWYRALEMDAGRGQGGLPQLRQDRVDSVLREQLPSTPEAVCRIALDPDERESYSALSTLLDGLKFDPATKRVLIAYPLLIILRLLKEAEAWSKN